MNIWHNTADAPRTPRRVSPTHHVELTIGTWPIGPGQAVWVRWAVTTADASRTDGTTATLWERNTEVNSYWVARLGPFAAAGHRHRQFCVKEACYVEFYAYMVDNQAIVIPETIDAIRALTGTVQDAATSIARTNAALGIEAALV